MDKAAVETHEGQEAERFDRGNLSIIEHKLIGSSPVTPEGEPIDAGSLIKQALEGNEQARHRLMTPSNHLNGRKNLEIVDRERKKEDGKTTRYVEGFFPFIDLDQQDKLSGKALRLELSKLTPAGEIDGSLKLRIDDPNLSPGTISQHIKDLSSLRLNPVCGSWLTLGEVAGETAPDGSFRPYRPVIIDFKKKT